ncbi:NACHT domain-containing protein [Brucella sp.]|uniref:NACHT domain-containing protein n=1 Tax=Brucella sp. TaxID=52132 RepID=UPI0028AA11F1|nr:NACHT domain-containing protein [Brucella sp.]
MSNQPNMNTIAAEMAAELIKSAFNSVMEKGSKGFKNLWSAIFEDFKPYMNDIYRKNSHVRIICQKENDVPFDKIYINSHFRLGKETFTDEDLISKIRDKKNIVINGDGGAGKTFFMRHLWMTLFKTSYQFTPIFYELRLLNDITDINIEAIIRVSISKKRELSPEVFSHFCDNGAFCFILDGFDEINVNKRDIIQKQIIELSNKYPNCRIVVSSRHEGRFAGWQNFQVFNSEPFTFSQVSTLVDKIPFDEPSKKAFNKIVDEKFYYENKTFLSNPLLCVMMLMTFKENMDIPKRMNIFYEHAFTTLYQWHDATKIYTREKCLDFIDFQRSFSMFCLYSYHKGKSEFTYSEIIDYISSSSKYCGITKKPDDILHDYMQSVNLIKMNGLSYTFIHRSFQEYFTAYALMRIVPNKFESIIRQIAERHSDSVILLCYEMNGRKVIDEYITPLYNRIVSANLLTSDGHRYFYLNSLGVKVSFTIGSGKPSMAFKTQSEHLLEFLINVRKIINSKNGVTFIATLFTSDEIFTAVRKIMKAIDVKVNQSFSINIDLDGIEITQDNKSGNDKNLKIDTSRYKDIIDKHNFDKTELLVQKELAEIVAWYRKQIRSLKRQEKSLDDILEL